MYADLTIREFMEKTASSAPVPGGGSVAALSAALAISLSQMVAGLTIGRKGFEDCQEEMKAIVDSASELRQQCLANIDRDSDAYNQVMAAFKLPRDSEEDKQARTEAIQNALKLATRVPLETAMLAFKIIELAAQAVEKGNPNAVTDGAVGAMLARTAVLAGLYNVKINLSSIKDGDFVADISKQVEKLEEKVVKKEKEILAKVNLRLGISTTE
jgi:formiminotetrahydrofolate cyclodeaminase